MFGLVSRERLKETELFWSTLNNENMARAQRVLELYQEMTDKCIELVRENERLKAEMGK